MNPTQLIRKGLYVSLEGVDGSGKTTLAPLAATAVGAFHTREPGGSPLAESVRKVLESGAGVVDPMAEMSLFFGARFALVSQVVAPKVRAGCAVVSDRSVASTFAYQISGRQLRDTHPGSEEVFWRSYDALPERPSLYVYLEVPYDVADARIREEARLKQLNHFDDVSPEEFARRRQGYDEFFSRVAELGHAEVVRIDASRPRGEILDVARQVIDVIEARVRASSAP